MSEQSTTDYLEAHGEKHYNELHALIKENLPADKDEISILDQLWNDWISFSIFETKAIKEFWEQEKPYILKYGMTAFNAGYAGL